MPLSADEVPAAEQEIVKELRAGKYSDALPKLQHIPKDSIDFVWSLQEVAKSYYKLERWSEFFGLAYFSRKALPATTETEKIRLLEVLALLRHCQLEQAKEILTLRPNPTDARLKDHFEVIAELLHIRDSVNHYSISEDKTSKPKGVFPRANLWPADKLELSKLDPYHLRRKVVGACAKKAAP